MASTYALPTSAIPPHHHSSSDFRVHTHSHSSSSCSQSSGHAHAPSLSSLSPSRTPRSHNQRAHSHNRSFGSMHDHHDHGHRHQHNHANRTPNRPTLPTILSASNSHWLTVSTADGKTVVTPTKARFDTKEYEPPALPVNHHLIERSKITRILLPYTARWPLFHTIMTEKDSRRIFYFMTLNFGFMMIQACYGYATDSLGLLSDSIHMFFDCAALAVGLFASVASKWAASDRFPYGFGKIETLSGFGNGVFLILISVEIIFEAFERIVEGRATKRLGELFIVSSMGLLVNLVGMAAFGHHHHGHDHGGHSHGCSQEHSHGHSQSGHSDSLDGHDHGHACEHGEKKEDGEHVYKHGHSHGHSHSYEHEHDHYHGHSHEHLHDNENMHGIYLHVLADTLGSAAVIASTVLTHFWGWAGWDPLASFLIAVLIILSAIPLVKSSARRLLLTVPDEIEYSLRDTLSGITGLRGVAVYSVPKFWIDDRDDGGHRAGGPKLLGVMHVVADRGADLEDVRDRVRNFLTSHRIEATVQVEREGDPLCWCGVGRSPQTALGPSSFGHMAIKSSAIFYGKDSS